MGLFGNLVKGALNVVVSPLVVATDILKGDFENTSNITDNVVNSVSDSVEDLTNGNL